MKVQRYCSYRYCRKSFVSELSSTETRCPDCVEFDDYAAKNAEREMAADAASDLKTEQFYEGS